MSDLLTPLLTEMPLRDLHATHEITQWLQSFSPPYRKRRMQVEMLKCLKLSSDKIEAICNDTMATFQDTWRSKHLRITGHYEVYIPDDCPLQFFAIFDDYQRDYVEAKLPEIA